MEDDGFLHIDGTVLEGGGQILRISIALSAIMGIPIKVNKIRGGRSKPGLAAQHLVGIELVADMCGAKIKGASIGSTEIEFCPGKRIRGGHYVADTRTAGSVSLLLQVALPCALFADGPVTFDLKGGTNADMAPQIDYMSDIFRIYLKRFGATFNMEILRRGYYPQGGGFVKVKVEPIAKLTATNLTERGDASKISGFSFVAGVLPRRLTKEMLEGFEEELRDLKLPIDMKVHQDPKTSQYNCSGIIAYCELTSGLRLGADGLAKRGASAVQVGRFAGALLRDTICRGACVDPQLQDQIIIYMALAEGKSILNAGPLTLHTKTAIHMTELIAKTKFTIQENDHKYIIECDGLGHINKHMSATKQENKKSNLKRKAEIVA